MPPPQKKPQKPKKKPNVGPYNNNAIKFAKTHTTFFYRGYPDISALLGSDTSCGSISG